MITGIITAAREAVIRMVVRGPSGMAMLFGFRLTLEGAVGGPVQIEALGEPSSPH
jgi:hypothetical protein